MKLKSHIKPIARILWVPISALFFFAIAGRFIQSANGILYLLTSESYGLWVRYSGVEVLILGAAGGFAVLHLLLECFAIRNRTIAKSRLLTHLRFGPVAVTFFFAGIVIAFDAAMIEVSKYQIRSYIFESGQSTDKPEIHLHNDYRGWCGNGSSAREEDLYLETALSGMGDDDPYIRARSLRIASDVRDFLNGPDRKYYEALQKGCTDNSQVVVETANDILSGSRKSCITLPVRMR